MKLSLTNFRALKIANFDLKKITFIAGCNEAGKTCTMQALAAATTGQVMPIVDVPKTQAHRFIHDGATAAEITLSGDNWDTKISYPSCVMSTIGKPLNISRVAAGLDSILDYDKKTRVAKLSEMIDALPNKDEVLVAFKNFSDVDFNEAWATIEKISWDQAHKNAMMKRTELTGEWKSITGQVFGCKVADGWLPAEWEPDLKIASEAGLKQQLKTCGDFLLTAQTSQAVSESEIAELKKVSAERDKIEKEIADCNEVFKITKKTADDVAAILAGLPKAEQPLSCKCPHCNNDVHYNGKTLEKITVLSPEELQLRKANIDRCQESLKSANTEVVKQNAYILELNAKKAIAINAAVRLEKISKRKETVSPEKIKELQNAVFVAENRLKSWQKKNNADSVFEKIKTAQSIVDILSPDGLRLDILKTELSAFNKTLASVCNAAQWPLTELLFDKDSISVNYGGRHYMFTSESAQFRARVCLQIATALYVKDEMVLIDRADILDVSGRNGLFTLLQGLKMDVVIGMTLTINQVNAMSAGVAAIGGAIYWIENGEAKEID